MTRLSAAPRRRDGTAARVLLLLLVLLPAPGDVCSFIYIGCHRDGGGTGTAMPCPDCVGSKRLLRYHPTGCPKEEEWSLPPAGTSEAPACAPAKVNKEYCAETCAAWHPWGGATAFYIGLESGVGVPAEGNMAASKPDYAECSCDTTLQYALPEAMAPTACPTKCPGNTESSDDRCGGGPGAFTVNLYQVDCSAWGGTFMLALVLALGVYLGVGIGMESRAGGSGGRPVLQRYPHYSRWVAGFAIVLDGVAFARGGGGGGRRAGERAAQQARLLDTGGGTDRPKAPKGKGAAESGSRQKKGGRKQKEKRATDERARTPADTPAARDSGSAAPARVAEPKSTPSAGSGRWVHVPT